MVKDGGALYLSVPGCFAAARAVGFDGWIIFVLPLREDILLLMRKISFFAFTAYLATGNNYSYTPSSIYFRGFSILEVLYLSLLFLFITLSIWVLAKLPRCSLDLFEVLCVKIFILCCGVMTCNSLQVVFDSWKNPRTNWQWNKKLLEYPP